MTELSYRTLRAEDALAEMSHHLTQAAHHTNKAHEAHRTYLSLLPGGGGETLLPGLPTTGKRRKVPKCLNIWTEYLQAHGPTPRQDIWDATKTRFTERAYPYTVEWEDEMALAPDDEFMDTAIFRIRGLKEGGGRGGAPVIFFLWGQRFDLYGRFGVGPSKRPDPTDTAPVLGVVHPPEVETGDLTPEDEAMIARHREDALAKLTEFPELTPVTDVTLEESEPTEALATMDEWHGRWDTLLETLASHDEKPTDEEFDAMIATMPADLPDQPKAILAVEYNKARRRAEVKRDAELEWG